MLTWLDLLEILARACFGEKSGGDDAAGDDDDDSAGDDDADQDRDDQDGGDDLDSLRRKLKAANSEAAERRVKNKALETRLKKLEEAQKKSKVDAERAEMEELDKIKAEKTDLEKERDLEKLRADNTLKAAAIINAASVAGFHNPKDAVGMIDPDAITMDDAGNIDEEEITKLIEALGEAKPYLVKGTENEEEEEDSGSGDFGATNPASKTFPKPKITTTQQIDKNREKALEAMKQGRVGKGLQSYLDAWDKGFRPPQSKKKNKKGG